MPCKPCVWQKYKVISLTIDMQMGNHKDGIMKVSGSAKKNGRSARKRNGSLTIDSEFLSERSGLDYPCQFPESRGNVH